MASTKKKEPIVKTPAAEVIAATLPKSGQEIVIAPTSSMQNKEAGDLVTFIQKASSNPKFDVMKLEKLIDLRDRILDRAAEEAFARDLVEMKPHLPRVLRTKHNSHTRSRYAPLEDINKVVDPILKQYGFADSCTIVEQNDATVTVLFKLWHRGGHCEKTPLTMPLDIAGFKGTANKSGPQGVASSITYCKRVAKCLVLDISTGDDLDGNQPPGEKKPDEFNEAMNQESNNQDEREKWDGKTIRAGKATIRGKWPTALEAGQELLRQLEKLKTRGMRIETINGNLGLIAALIENNQGNMVGEMHKLADQGQDEEAPLTQGD